MPAYNLTEILTGAVAALHAPRLESSDWLTGMSHRRFREKKHDPRTWTLIWEAMTLGELQLLEAMFQDDGGGSGTTSWTTPEAETVTVQFVSDSLNWVQDSANSAKVTVDILELMLTD